MSTHIREHLIGKPLTEHQQQIWDMREQGKTIPEIAAARGVSPGAIEKAITYIRSKKGLTTRDRGHKKGETIPGFGIAAHHVGPAELVANAVDQVNEKMQAVGIPERLRASIVRRLKVKHEGLGTPVKAITDPELISGIRKNLSLIDSYIDDKVVSEASLRDLATAKAQLIEKLQLLEGKPTAILSDLERKSLIELMPLFFAEAQRRGVTLPGQITEKVVSPA